MLPDFAVVVHAVESVATFFLIGLIGYVLAARGWFSRENREMITRLITQVALPLYLIHNINSAMSRSELLELAYGIAPAFMSISLMFCLALGAARLLKIPGPRRGVFCAGIAFSNTMYIGLPINLALFGPKAIPFVILYYFANTSLFWSAGSYLLAADGDASGQSAFRLETAKRILSPAVLGFAVGLLLLLLDWKPPIFLANAAMYMGSLTTPLAMVSIGVILQSLGLAGIRFDRDMLLMFFGRYVLSPASIILIAGCFGLPGLMRKVFIVQSALPMMSTLPILASFHRADGEYATVAVSASTLAGLVTIPLSMLAVNIAA
ncbi:MAG: AEC family transporter [Planctomycetota bacterium]|jgi:predicted permease|nr:AEC family transporter [Planctomycetota bacterium]